MSLNSQKTVTEKCRHLSWSDLFIESLNERFRQFSPGEVDTASPYCCLLDIFVNTLFIN